MAEKWTGDSVSKKDIGVNECLNTPNKMYSTLFVQEDLLEMKDKKGLKMQ